MLFLEIETFIQERLRNRSILSWLQYVIVFSITTVILIVGDSYGQLYWIRDRYTEQPTRMTGLTQESRHCCFR